MEGIIVNLADIQKAMDDRNIQSIATLAYQDMAINEVSSVCPVQAERLINDTFKERFGNHTREQFYAAVHLLENKLEWESIEVDG
jgi:hypothetical protein